MGKDLTPYFSLGYYVIFLGRKGWNNYATLAHELTHVTQYEQWGAAEYYRQGINARMDIWLGIKDPYVYTIDGRPYSAYEIEQQASITEDCYGGNNAACSVTPLHRAP
jgi:hypothetical protein